jgi:WS/DGAT/MGAT family acyltransferase
VTWSERLSPLDVAFLDLERDRSAHMHVGMVAVFEGPAPAYRDLVQAVEARLDEVPRYRQRLAFVPFGQGRPVWVDEADLDLEHHIRHTALPAPGGEEQLKRLAARLFAQRLDHDKPLWELWFVEGLPDGRFALVAKTHHAMIDGISGVDIANVILSKDPEPRVPPAPPPWRPRRAPSTAKLLRDAVSYQVTHPFSIARDALREGTPAREMIKMILGGLPELAKIAATQAPRSSLNQPIGPHRRFEMVKLDLGAVKRVRAALGGTVNDVILAVVAGSLRALLDSRGEPPEDLRVMIPVSVRTSEQRGKLGNQVTAIFCSLPVSEPDPVKRLEAVSKATRSLKDSRQAVGAIALTRLGEFMPPTIAAQAGRLQSMMSRVFNLVVTNVPGPQHPLYLLGRRMLASYPCLPLATQTTVGIALLSYDGSIGVGLLGDADKARDLPVLAHAVPAALEELVGRAETRQEASASPP